MTTHRTATREEWLVARRKLLEAEKELTQKSDELARRRQELPWVPIEKRYRFNTDEGSATIRERPGMSAFILEDGVVYHTYSTYARGLDILWGAYQWLDRAPKGRNETGYWWRRHDEYGKF
jgi:predicted dithiol-disulfide oxidoreductase (DUF899 family)